MIVDRSSAHFDCLVLVAGFESVFGTHYCEVADGHLIVVDQVRKICHNRSVLALEVAPVLAAILPYFLVCISLTTMVIGNCDVVTVVIDSHERPTWALFVFCVVRIVTYVNPVILKVLVLVCMLMRRQTIVQVLNEHHTMLEK